MKKILPLILLCALLLTSCASLLEREYTTAAAHVESPAIQGDAAYRVETYPALRSALLSYIEEGMTAGVLHSPTTYAGNLTVDLEKARHQLTEEEPVAACALESLTYQTSRIVSYYEVKLEFTYREGVDPAALSALPAIRSESEVYANLHTAMEALENGLTLSLRGTRDAGEVIAEALERTQREDPLLHIGFPHVDVALYPENSPRAIAELTFRYPQSAQSVRRVRERTWEAALELAGSGSADFAGDDWLMALLSRCEFDPEGGSTAADALLYGRANEEGLARGCAAVMTAAGNPTRVEERDGHWYIHSQNGDDFCPAWPDGIPETRESQEETP